MGNKVFTSTGLEVRSRPLFRELPDRENRAENHGEINRAFEKAAFFFFRANDQRVGRFEFLSGVGFVFHRVDLVDASSLLQSPCHRFAESYKSLECKSLSDNPWPNDWRCWSRARDYSFRIWDEETRTKQKRRGMNPCASIERTCRITCSSTRRNAST